MMDDDRIGWSNQGRDDDRNRALSALVATDAVYVVLILAVLGWIVFS